MKYLLLLIALITLNVAFSQKVSRIYYENLKRTKANFLNQRLDIKIGDTISKLEVEESIVFLKDLNLFFDIESRIEPQLDGSIHVCFVVYEATYIYPVISDLGTDEKLKISVGVADINFGGRKQTLGVLYEYYDRHSFKFYQITPWHKNNRTGHEFFLGKISTIEPLYFDSISALFNYDNYSASAGLYYWFNRYLKSSVGTMFAYESYLNNDADFNYNGNIIEMNERNIFYKYQLRAGLTYNRIGYDLESRKGFYNNFHVETIQTIDYPDFSFFKVTNEFKYFKKLSYRGNFAFRQSIGLSSNTDSPFSPFVIDGFINIRGSGNRIARGTGELILNAEYLFTLWRNKFFFLQSNTFIDVGFLRPPAQSISTAFNPENSYYYAGLGLKFQLRVIYNSVLSFDYGINLQDVNQGGFLLGFGHFF